MNCFHSRVASGAGDGEVRLWDLAKQKCTRIFKGHDGRLVRGIVFTPDGKNILSVGDDKKIMTWSTENDSFDTDTPECQVISDSEALDSVNSKHILTGISYHRNEDKFATCGDVTQLWDAGSNYPVKEFQWGVDTVHSIKFNQVLS